MKGFNDGLRKAQESLIVALSILHAVEYDTVGDEVQYGPDDRALPKVHPPAPQGTLARLAAEFDLGTSQVGDGPPMLKAINAHTDPPLESDIVVDIDCHDC